MANPMQAVADSTLNREDVAIASENQGLILPASIIANRGDSVNQGRIQPLIQTLNL